MTAEASIVTDSTLQAIFDIESDNVRILALITATAQFLSATE